MTLPDEQLLRDALVHFTGREPTDFGMRPLPINAGVSGVHDRRLEVQAEPIFAGLIRAYAVALRQDERYRHHIFIGNDGAVWTSDPLPDLTPAGLPVTYSDMTVRLRDEDARALHQALRELFERVVRLSM